MTSKKNPRSSLARLGTFALMIALLLCCALSVTGCFAFVPETPDADDDPDAITEGDQSGENGGDDEQKPSSGEDDASELTYEQFVAQYPQLARQFALDRMDELSYADDVLSTSYAYVASGEKISQLLIANVVIAGETERQLKIATFEFVGGLRAQDIACGKDLPTVTTKSENALTFDAKEEFFKQNFTIKAQIDAKIEQNLGTAAVEISSYQLEEFEPDVQLPTTVAQMVAEYPDKVKQILNEKCFDLAANTTYTLNFNVKNMQWAKWYLDGSDQITSIQFVMDYHRPATSGVSGNIGSTTLTLNSPISIEDFLDGNFNVTKAVRDYYWGYNPAQQGTRDELMNSIAETCGLNKEYSNDTIRLFHDSGSTLTDKFGEGKTYTLIEITKTKIIQYGITIKGDWSNTDSDFIAQLASPQNYSLTLKADVDLHGMMLECVSTSLTESMSTCHSNSQNQVYFSQKFNQL